MFPTILEIGPITLYSYGLMIALGFITVLYFMRRDARSAGIDPDAIADTAFWTLILGVIATRVAHIILYSDNYSWTDPIGWIDVTRGGLVFQGAIPVGIAYAYWNLTRRGVNFWQAADVVMPWVPVAQAFGRGGCFLKGCCHGARSDDLPWGVSFPEGSPAYLAHQAQYAAFPDDAPWSYPVHPTQIYSILLLLAMCGALMLLRRRRPFFGVALPGYLVLYGICRFIVEMYRGDGNPVQSYLGVQLTSQQAFCVLMIVIGAALAAWLYRRRGTESVPPFPQAG